MTEEVLGVQAARPIQIKTPPTPLPGFNALLEAHGCLVEEQEAFHLITFPAGTTRTPVGVVTMTYRAVIRFPDGYQLLEQYDWHRERSVLFYSPDGKVPEEELKRQERQRFSVLAREHRS